MEYLTNTLIAIIMSVITASEAQDRFTYSIIPVTASRISDNHMISGSSGGRPAYRVNEQTTLVPDPLNLKTRRRSL